MVNIVGKVLKTVFGTKQDRDMKRYQPWVDAINDKEDWAKNLTDTELQEQTAKFKEALNNGEDILELVPEAFAVVREAGKRVLNMRHYDVQMVGGMALLEGKIAEMMTGEGKTLVATLAAYLRALVGKGVHVVTVNDYLAKRDREWMGPLYEFLGLTVGVIQNDLNPEERRAAYGCDITYGTNNEYGFDYLRDNMAITKEHCVQRELYFGIVDEVDSILIDEARTPLIISGPAEQSTEKYYEVDAVVRKLKKEEHFTVDEKDGIVTLTEEGSDEVERIMELNIYDEQNINLIHHVQQALRAHNLFKLDDRYMVEDGEVVIVDEFTGRKMPGRRYSDGLHQALEAKEGLKIQRESQTYASITFQNYFRLYNILSGMTGTAVTEANEFMEIYKLDVTEIPSNAPLARLNHPDSIYKTEREKYNAIADEIERLQKKGQPVLVGTVSIEKSEKVSTMLKKRGVRHHVLNAKQHEKEAEIVIEAGQQGSVTIATNMAGRGTDIKLGEGVKDLGGLYILGTERHESRRIDNQLRGRSGRQGDPGEARFYLSLEDDLMRIFGGERIKSLAERFGMAEGEVIEHSMVSRAVENAQKKVEAHHFDMRKHILKYDDVMNKQREVIYKIRRSLLEGEKPQQHMWSMIDEVIEGIKEVCITDNRDADQWETEQFSNLLLKYFNIHVGEGEDPFELLSINQGMSDEDIYDVMKSRVKEQMDGRLEKFGEEFANYLMSIIMLRTVDAKWKEHLYSMDHLKSSVGFRAYGQKDPLQEYQKEGFAAFEEMYAGVQKQCVQHWFHVEVQQNAPQQQPAPQQQQPKNLTYGREEVGGNPQQQQQRGAQKPAPVVNRQVKVGRNDPCPCGSGKKYKKCCMQKEQGAA